MPGCADQGAVTMWRGVRPARPSGTLRRVPRRKRRAGFSLLETVVAMAVFAAAGTALFAFFNTNLIALGRVESTSAQVPVARAAYATLSAINPAERQAGRFEVGDHEVAWTAALVAPMRSGNSVSGVPGLYQVGLYEVVFHIRDGERALGTWRVRQVGYRNARRAGVAR